MLTWLVFSCSYGWKKVDKTQVNPIPASSGNTVRHRLNRGGDRTLNSALHMVAITKMTYDAETREYVEKRRAEHKTEPENPPLYQTLPRPPCLPDPQRLINSDERDLTDIEESQSSEEPRWTHRRPG